MWSASSSTRKNTRPDMPTVEQRRALLRVALAAVLANASRFSATAVVPALEHDWHLTPAGAAWLVIMVQIGAASPPAWWSTPASGGRGRDESELGGDGHLVVVAMPGSDR